jgi:putative hemolysin
MISVEELVSQRFPGLPQRYGMQRVLLTALRHLLHETEYQQFSARYPALRGFDFVEQILEEFRFATVLSDRERERIPSWGPVVIIANHPIGTLDGLALLKLVGQVRRDVKAVANDVLMALEPLRDLLLPVDNMGGHTPRQNVLAIERHLEAGGAVLIFPAGEVSRIGPRGIRDGAWRPGFLRMAARAKAPVLPIFVDARNSAAFYGLSLLAKPLGTLWLVREMFKHSGAAVRIRIGEQIEHATYSALPVDSRTLVNLFRRQIYRLGRGGSERCFTPLAEALAHPENRQALRAEVRRCERLGQVTGGLSVHLYRRGADSALMREIGRLRELSFRAVGEGSGRRRDIDRFDCDYDHLIVWDDDELEVAGAYRLRRAGGELLHREGLYSQTLFHWLPEAAELFAEGLELGRSFVQPRYQRRRSLDLLWQGIGAYLRRHPDVRYLFGPVSISNRLPAEARNLLVSFYSHYFPPRWQWAVPRLPYSWDVARYRALWEPLSCEAGTALLRQHLAALGVSIPTLLKQYAELCEPGGVEFVGFNVDPEFADCIDGLIVVDVTRIHANKQRRWFGRGEAATAA